MSLASVLEQSCPSLAERWVTAANAVYPLVTAGFLRSRQDPFANPVGRRSAELAPLLCRAVIGLSHDDTALRAAMEEFIRVRAMQDMPVETSLKVFFAYKDIIKAHVRDQGIELTQADFEELEGMDARCDSLALLAFGIYSRLREGFYEARVQDVRRRHSQIVRLAQRHGLTESGMESGTEFLSTER